MEACMLFSRKLRRELSACTNDEVLLPLHRPRVRGKCSSLVTCLRSETHGCRDVHSPAGFRDFYLQYKVNNSSTYALVWKSNKITAGFTKSHVGSNDKC
jgi:hypothetical protein